MAEDAFEDGGIGEEGEDAQGAVASGAAQGIEFATNAARRCPRARSWAQRLWAGEGVRAVRAVPPVPSAGDAEEVAARPMLVRSFVRARLVLASMGLAAGLILAVPATRWLDSLLFETPTWDPLTWLGVIGVVVLTSAVAAWIPARRASRVDPREVLSAE